MPAATVVPCTTLARTIGRLSLEVQRLAREIPLGEGRLLELEMHPQPVEGAVQRVAQEIRAARQALAAAEADLVQMEILFRRHCGGQEG